ncbi:nuclear transport factor 2 family protein [Algoriphagus mannitolivorans]|uniref:nuclear transport factor 2 family protein n=1 Tax=Algoriphagus mannitolivorans TaxID=226504 RepID=UPI000478CABA|nr:nuclear transport factor 2 family protein [Algoriphagus mannitolivorans]
MKNVIGLTLIVWILMSCQKESRYTQQAPEIESVKAMFAAYNAGDYEAQRKFYDANAEIFINAPETKPTTLDQAIADMNKDKDLFNNAQITIQEDAIERVITDKGEIWVNVWGEWKATLAATGKEYLLPFHETFQFMDGKIVKEFGYWDNSPIVQDMMKAEMAKASADSTMNQ